MLWRALVSEFEDASGNVVNHTARASTYGSPHASDNDGPICSAESDFERVADSSERTHSISTLASVAAAATVVNFSSGGSLAALSIVASK